MSNLHSQLTSLATSFANAVLEAIRGASLEDLLSESSAPTSRARREQLNGIPRPVRARSSGRLKRRSPEDIAGALEQVVALVKKHKNGLRAEQIRDELNMQAKEMPRVLKEGLAKRQLKSRGQKRATTYFAS
jgi:hypothetical protein